MSKWHHCGNLEPHESHNWTTPETRRDEIEILRCVGTNNPEIFPEGIFGQK